jgi:uncharacterized protein YdaU (DUF1376 family)
MYLEIETMQLETPAALPKPQFSRDEAAEVPQGFSPELGPDHYQAANDSQMDRAAGINPGPRTSSCSAPEGEPVSDNIMKAALDYANRGWQVFPLHGIISTGCTCGSSRCDSPGKHPRSRHGMKDATTDQSQIRKWWNQWPDANIGVRTGSESNLAVIDIDNAAEKNGQSNFDDLVALHGEIPPTLTVRTGRGEHLYFQCPGTSVKCSASRLAAGVDVRADGGYVVAPPSMHISGRRYEWENESCSVADLPEWLLSLLQDRSIKSAGADEGAENGETDGIQEGMRNDSLFRMASALRGQHGMNKNEIEPILLEQNRLRCKPPLPDEEVLAIVHSVCKFPAERGPKKSAKRMEQNPLYWLPFSIRDFYADQTVQTMEDYQVGWYLKLLVSAWANGGFLPFDYDKLWKLAGANSEEAFLNDCEPVLADYEEVEVDGLVKLRNPQLAATFAEKLALWMKKVDAGKEAQARRKQEQEHGQTQTAEVQPSGAEAARVQ